MLQIRSPDTPAQCEDMAVLAARWGLALFGTIKTSSTCCEKPSAGLLVEVCDPPLKIKRHVVADTAQGAILAASMALVAGGTVTRLVDAAAKPLAVHQHPHPASW